MKKIQRTSQLLYYFFKVLCWTLPLATIYLVLFDIEGMFNWGAWSSIVSSTRIQDTSYSLLHRLCILGIQLLPLSITIIICSKLSKLFSLYGQGDLFEEKNIQLIRGISIFMILGELLQLIYQPLITIALSFNNAVGERFASITLGTANASTLITAIIILIASWIITEAHQLKSDSQLTI